MRSPERQTAPVSGAVGY